MTATGRRVHTGVVGKCIEAVLAQKFSGLFDFFTRQAIDNAGFTGMFGRDEIQQLTTNIFFFNNLITNVRTIK